MFARNSNKEEHSDLLTNGKKLIYMFFEFPAVTESDIQVTESVIREAPTEAVVEDIQENENTGEVENNSAVEEVKETVNGVDPDLKAFLDSYEAFMDEYVDFMKKYMADPGNVINMLSEYSDIMSR